MSDPRYHTARWRKRREYQLRVRPLCEMCEKEGRVTRASIADHKEPHRGDEDKFWNGELQSLCASCHSARKQMQEIHGYSQACGVDGLPLDDRHPWGKK